MAFAYEGSNFQRARVFKWNQTLPEDIVPPGVGFLMLLIKNKITYVSSKAPYDKDVTYMTVPESLMFNLQDLSSRANMEDLVLDALERTYMFSRDEAYCLAAKISKYLVSNFRFDIVDTLSRTNVAKTVIVVDIFKIRAFVCDQAEGVVIGDKNFVYGYDDIVSSLRTSLDVKPIASDEPIGLVQVPSLKMFEFDGNGVSKEDICAICLEELLGNQRSVRKTSCSHVFHGGCLARWLWTKQSCPMCRSQLP